jgi:elongation factor Ts
VTDIPARLVKQLREMSGAPMMDCKRALIETGGNLEMALKLLREWGIASAGKRAGRETTEGRVLARVEEKRGTLVAIGCETEPVSKNEEFLSFARRLLESVHERGPAAVAELEPDRLDLIGKIGENVVVTGSELLEAQDGDVLSAYVHPPAEKIGVLVRAKSTPELAKLVAMHIAFANPRFATREEVPEDEIAAERQILEKLPDLAGKPDQIRAQIIEGRLAKGFFADAVLADQAWIHDPDMSVGQALAEHGAEVRDFVRYNVGA